MYRVFFVALVLVLGAPFALANDGGIAFGGSPKLLNSHPTISMVEERIVMDVGEEQVKVDCRFVFKNAGPACTVRMGFPDQGVGEAAADEFDPDWKKLPPRTQMTSFRSYVDGREVATRLIRADKQSEFWHEKLVSFPAGAKRAIRDVYTVNVGGQVGFSPRGNLISLTRYILHTGASWKGNIGRTEIVVNFNRKRMTSPLKPVRITSAAETSPSSKRVFGTDWSAQRGRVYYHAPSSAVVSGKTLRFVRTNWRPTTSDDLWLAFDCR